MQITVELPDDLAQRLIRAGQDPARAVLENVAVEAFRAQRLTEHQLAQLLGMDRYQLDGFLKDRGVWLDYTIDDLHPELEAQRKLGL
jgi:predicted HTH domain antitoxin